MALIREASNRAGRYVAQSTRDRAFSPAPLPPQPQPPLELTGQLQGLLSKAERALGRLDGSVLTLPNPDLFVVFLQGVIEVAAEAAETARRILQLREEHRAAITAQLGRAAGNGHKVLESLFDRPIVAVSDVQALQARPTPRQTLSWPVSQRSVF